MSIEDALQDLADFRPRVEMICYCGDQSEPFKFCPWPGLPDELVLCPECRTPPKVLRDLGLDEHFVWNGKQYVTFSPLSGGGS